MVSIEAQKARRKIDKDVAVKDLQLAIRGVLSEKGTRDINLVFASLKKDQPHGGSPRIKALLP